MIDKLLNFLYKVLRLYKPHIDRWVVKAFIGTGFSLIISGLTGLSWYVALMLNIIKEESQKNYGTDYGIGTIEWTTLGIGSVLVLIGMVIYFINKRLERNLNITPNLLIAIIHKSIDDFMIPDFKQINDGKYKNYQIQLIEIDQTKTYSDGNLNYPDYSIFEQQNLLTKIRTLVDSNSNYEIAYFGLAHIPLLFYIGTQIADKFNVIFFEYNRNTYEWAYLKNAGHNLNIINESDTFNSESSNALIFIETSYPIERELAYEIVPDYNLSHSIKSKNIGLDSITDFNEIIELSKEFRKIIDSIIQKSNIEIIHIFYAGPPSLAVNLARKISRRTDPKFIIYNYMNSQSPKYKWGLVLNSDYSINNLIIKN
jgi:hypothetical protein